MENKNRFEELWAELNQKATEFADKGEKVVKEDLAPSAKELYVKTMTFVEEKIKPDELAAKAGKFIDEKVKPEELIEKAKEMLTSFETKLKDYADAPIKKTKGSDLDESLFDVHDSFFAKAEKFANKTTKKTAPEDSVKKDDDIIINDMKITRTEEEKTKKKDDSSVYGFDDLDGDGDEIIDDAIIDTK